MKKFADSAFAGCDKLKYVVINTIKPPKSIYNSDYDSVLLVTYPEFEKIQSNKTLKRLIQTKRTIDLRR